MNFCILLYFCSSSAHQKGDTLDSLLTKLSFTLAIGACVIYVLNSRQRLDINGYMMWLFFFFGYYYISVLWANSTTHLMSYSGTFIQIFGVSIVLINVMKSRDGVDTVLRLLLLSLVYAAFLLFVLTPREDFGSERLGGVLGLHPNEIGLRFALGVLIALYFAIAKKKRSYYLMVILFTVGTILTGSRKSIIVCILSLALYPMFCHGKHKIGKDFSNFIFRVLVITTLICGVVYVVMNTKIFYDVLGVRFESMLDAFGGNSDADSSVNERNYFISKAIDLFKEHPIIGYGGNNFRTYMGEINFSHVSYSHNNFVEILSTLGIIGFMIYYSLIGFMIVKSISLFFKNTKHHYLNSLVMLIMLIVTFISYWCVIYQTEFISTVYLVVYMHLRFENKELVEEKKCEKYNRSIERS